MPNPAIGRIGRDDLPPALQAAWDSMSAIAGEAVSVEAMAAHPALLSWYNENFYGKLFGNADGTMKTDSRSKEILRLRLSKGHGCHVCNSHNVRTSLAEGFTQEQIDGILSPRPGLFGERDQAVIDLAAQIELGNQDGTLSPELYGRLRRHFDDAQILELGMIGAFLTGMAKFLFVFDLVSRDAVCSISPAPAGVERIRA